MSSTTPMQIQLLRERSWLQGTFLSTAAFGGNVVFFVLNLNLLWNRARSEIRRDGRSSKETGWLLGYITFIILLCSTMEAVEVDVAQPQAQISHVNRSTPMLVNGTVSMMDKGASFRLVFAPVPTGIIGNICFSLINWSVAILLLWRCYVIYRNSKSSIWLLLSFPALVYLTSFASGVIYLIKIIMRDAIPFPILTVTLIHGTIVLTSNLIFTFMIVIRLYLYRRSITQLVGLKYAGHYTSIASMFIESAAVVNVLILLILVALALKSPITTLVLLSLTEIQALASFMIIYRVAKGTAWSSGTANELIAQNVGRGVGDPSIAEAERLSAMRFRVTSQMTQASTAFNFNHAGSLNMLSSVRDSASGSAVGRTAVTPCQQACAEGGGEEDVD